MSSCPIPKTSGRHQAQFRRPVPARRRERSRKAGRSWAADHPAGLLGEGLEEVRLVGLLRRRRAPGGPCARRPRRPGCASARPCDPVQDDRGGLGGGRRRLLQEAPGALGASSCRHRHRSAWPTSTPIAARCAARAWPSSSAVIGVVLGCCSSTLRELATIAVPMWPGITTEHLTCGALQAQVGDQRLGEALHGELGRGSRRCAGPAGPIEAQKPLTLDGVDDVAAVGAFSSIGRKARVP